MIKIYDVDTALRTILQREPLFTMTYPKSILEGTEHLFGQGVTPSMAVAEIIKTVLEDGDQALRKWSKLLDHFEPTDFRVPTNELEQAAQALPSNLLEAMDIAIDRIRSFHKLQPLPDWDTQSLGGRLGQRVTAVESIGVYVPSGTAPLPSSLLMAVIPAQVAGVTQIVVCTPPKPHASILAAAYLCGVDRVYQLGGAQAIAALALGSDSVPRVDKIVGAGNLFVTLAKQQVYGMVGLDGLAGPTETMVIADHTATPSWIAADLLAQAEHDVLASAILLTPDRKLAQAVQIETANQMEDLSRVEIIAQSLNARSGIVITPDLETAADLASNYGPEHMCLSVANPEDMAKRIHNAGGLFLGEGSFEVLGDYIAGPSHIMPTGGTARFASPLNVLDFVKITSLIALDETTSANLSPLAAIFARSEGLTAHATAAEYRSGVQNV
jgi:histidinol dehydrogenase